MEDDFYYKALINRVLWCFKILETFYLNIDRLRNLDAGNRIRALEIRSEFQFHQCFHRKEIRSLQSRLFLVFESIELNDSTQKKSSQNHQLD